MAAGSVRGTEHEHEWRRRVLVLDRLLWDVATSGAGPLVGFLIVLELALITVACTPIARLRPYDPEKDFAYALLEHREPGDAMVVTRATLESHGREDHALVIDETVDDARVLCVDLPAAAAAAPASKPREACVTMAVVRKLIQEVANGSR